LKKTRLPVDTITVRCGFEDTSSFIRLFRRRFGMTPLGFRAERRVGEGV
jgi:transcriptional regulator GlxA family with amidase domain